MKEARMSEDPILDRMREIAAKLIEVGHREDEVMGSMFGMAMCWVLQTGWVLQTEGPCEVSRWLHVLALQAALVNQVERDRE
jgi:hypothetical protein